MVKDTFNSILDNIKERTTNPFLGTLIVVWLFKNWKLVYSLIYFDSKLTLKARLDYIDVYFKDTNFLWNLFYTILITLGILTLTYALLSVSRLLTDTYDRIVIPWLSKITDKNSIVLKTVHNALQEEYRNLEKRLEEERLAKITAQKERDDAYLKLEGKMSGFPNEDDFPDYQPTEDPVFHRISKRFEGKDGIESLNKMILLIQDSQTIARSNTILEVLMREGLIEFAGEDVMRSDKARYRFTIEGHKFLKYWNDYIDKLTN